jgi:hypothetical protein
MKISTAIKRGLKYKDIEPCDGDVLVRENNKVVKACALGFAYLGVLGRRKVERENVNLGSNYEKISEVLPDLLKKVEDGGKTKLVLNGVWENNDEHGLEAALRFLEIRGL